MKKVIEHKHLCVNIRGMLNQFRRKSMAGLIVDKGRDLSDEEVRNYLYDHIKKGHKVLPMCDEDECPYKHFYNKMMSKPSDNMTVLMHKVDSLENKKEYYSSFYDIHSNLLSIHKFININKKYC